MQTSKKQILGLVGLATVGAMTATAYYLPTPDASADSTVAVPITAVIMEQTVSAAINRPVTDRDYASAIVPIDVTYSFADKLDFKLTYTDVDGVQHVQTWTETFADYESGNYVRNINVKDYGYSYGDYRVEVIAYGRDSSTFSDTVRFSYLGTVGNVDRVNEENGNSILDIKDDGDADHGEIQVYDENGRPIFIENGVEQPIEFTKDDFDANGELSIELPMDKYNAAEGDYMAVITVRDENGNVIGVRRIKFHYVPKIEVPNTGSLASRLNLSESDMVVSGLLAFLVAVMIAIWMMRKQTKQSKR